MCTSFIKKSSGKTYIGMNFDISPRPIPVTLKKGSQLIVSQQQGGRLLPSFGINRSGAFMNQLMVEPCPSGMYRRTKDAVHLTWIFNQILDGSLDISGLHELMVDKAVVNPPGFSLHSLITDYHG